MAFWAYILRCSDGLYYTGHTDNLEHRVNQHQSGEIRGFTSARLPVHLIWADYFQTRIEALEAEARIKKWSKAKKEALAKGDWESVSYFAKPPRERVSTSLDTNGGWDENAQPSYPLVSNEVETRREVETQAPKK